jgi:hypothetical protein
MIESCVAELLSKEMKINKKTVSKYLVDIINSDTVSITLDGDIFDSNGVEQPFSESLFTKGCELISIINFKGVFFTNNKIVWDISTIQTMCIKNSKCKIVYKEYSSEEHSEERSIEEEHSEEERGIEKERNSNKNTQHRSRFI